MAVKPVKDTFNATIAYQDFYKTNGLTVAEHGTHPVGPSMTRAEFAEECDINTIMARYDGYLSDPMASLREARYIDFTNLPDTLMGTMEMVKTAADAFYRLPAVVRKEFDNNPVAFADFAADPTNVDRMREWGLAAPAPAPEAPIKVQVMDPAPKPADKPASS